MAIAVVASASQVGTSSGSTTSGINTAGANLLVVVVGFQQGSTITVSDNKGNTWTALTASSNVGADACQIFYCTPSTVGSGHTFTVAGTAVYASIDVLAVSGAAATSPFDQQNGAANTASTIQPGSVTPGSNNELVIAGLAWNTARTTYPPTINSSFTVQQSQNFSSGNGYGSALAYLIQTTATAANPTWSQGTSSTNSARIATFKAAPAAFAYYKAVTVDHTQVGSSDSANFPLTIALDGNVQAADADLKTVGNGGFVQSSNGYDIRPYADAALTTPLTFELVYYQASTGQLEMHVKIPTVSHTSDTVFYLAFGNATITTDGSSSATWDSNYMAVWHMVSNGGNVEDSTSNGNTLSPNNGATFTTGQIDTGIDLTPNNSFFSAADTASLNVSTDFTMSGWLLSGGLFMSNDNPGPVSHAYILNSVIGAQSIFTIRGGADITDTGAAIPTGAHLITVTHTGTSYNFYIDGVLSSTVSDSHTIQTALTSGFYVGYYGEFNFYAKGISDEYRISDILRSADWIKAEYNSQKASSTLLTWGSKTAAGGGTLYTQTLTESLTMSDGLSKTGKKALTESATMSDSLTRKISRGFSETLAFTDTLLKKSSRTLTESLALSDGLTKQTQLPLAESIALSDSLSRQNKKALAETVSLTDSLNKATAKTPFTESVTLSDVLSSLKTFLITLSESFAISDSLVKRTQKVMTETLTFLDTLTKATARILTEQITMSDVLAAVKTGGATIKNYYTGGISAAKRMMRGIGF